ncbi:hypothetical protein QFC19_001375 [Naganishia cerealis]|uniref:Uncharacterized protein n=1 Tax=Naganishia cerealis TaxID=610337 RepID=A0ACC2WIG4_9TREE|nr:hypothetical protein QFC19_001375 [Naganishia cerealis]
MADSAIIIAIVSLITSFIATLLSALAAGGITLYSESRRRRQEAEKLISKYKDPLFLASGDLVNRLEALIEDNLTWLTINGVNPERKGNLLLFTTFTFGQYLSWVWILRRQIQFLRFVTGEENLDLTEILNRVAETLYEKDDMKPFRLYRGHQFAIGEIMSVREPDGSLICMGYAQFVRMYNDTELEESFRRWFEPIHSGITDLATALPAQGDDMWERREKRYKRLADVKDLLETLRKQLKTQTKRRWASLTNVPEFQKIGSKQKQTQTQTQTQWQIETGNALPSTSMSGQ